MVEVWRAKIQASMLITCLLQHAQGKRKMSTTQVRAAEILLKKVMPDKTENVNTNTNYEESIEARAKAAEDQEQPHVH